MNGPPQPEDGGQWPDHVVQPTPSAGKGTWGVWSHSKKRWIIRGFKRSDATEHAKDWNRKGKKRKGKS